jgi:uncharacterized protein
MAVRPSYPGVYVEEVPSGVRSIVGVSTSTTAFVGFTPRGPSNKATRVLSFGDFARVFGGLSPLGDLGHVVQQYFQNGGTEAWIVRVVSDAEGAEGAKAATATLMDNIEAGTAVLTATAASEGAWGDSLYLAVDYDTADKHALFNLHVMERRDQNGRRVDVQTEVHRNLSMEPGAASFAVDVVNAASTLIRLTSLPNAADKARPNETPDGCASRVDCGTPTANGHTGLQDRALRPGGRVQPL